MKPREHPPERLAPWAKLLIFALLIFVVRNAEFLASPDHQEIGDLAATMLQVDEATEGRGLLGPYSRFGFHHPGPASIYLWAVSQKAFAFIPSPVARAYLIQLLINFAFVGAAAFWVSRLRTDRISATWFVAIALISIRAEAGQVQNAWISLWGPDVVVAPTLAVLVAGSAVFAGHFNALPLVILGASFAVHNHVGTAIVVVPVVLFAVGSMLWRGLRGDNPRSLWRPALFSTVIAIAAAAPILVEQWTRAEGNLHALWVFAQTANWRNHGFDESIVVVLSRLGALPNSLLALFDIKVYSRAPALLLISATSLIGGSLLALRSDAMRRARPLVIVALLALLLGIVSAMRVTGPLHSYLLRFEFAAVAVLAWAAMLQLVERIAPLNRWCEGHARVKVFTAGFALLALLRPEMPVASPPPLNEMVTTISRWAPDHAVELQFEPTREDQQLWGQLVGLVLQLRREGVEVYTDSRWDVLIANNRSAPAQPTIPLVHLDNMKPETPASNEIRSRSMRAVLIKTVEGENRSHALLRWHAEKLAPVPFGVELKPDHDGLAFDGWYPGEGTYRWSRGTESRIAFRLDDETPPGPLTLKMKAGVVGEQAVTFSINQQVIKTVRLSGFGPHPIELEIPSAAIGEGGLQILTVSVPGARPVKPGAVRTLGVHVGAILLGK